MESVEGVIPPQEEAVREPVPVFNIPVRRRLGEYMYSGVRSEYARRLELMKTDASSTPSSFISEDIQESDEARLAREGADLLERADKEGLSQIIMRLTEPDTEVLKKYLTVTGSAEGRLRAEMIGEFNASFISAKNTERMRSLGQRLKSLVRPRQ